MRILKVICQVEIIILLKHLILPTNSQGNVQQPEGRIKNQILGVKGGFLYLYNVLFQVLLDKSDGISSRIESLKKNSQPENSRNNFQLVSVSWSVEMREGECVQRTAWAVVISMTSTTADCSLPALLLIFTAKGPDTEILE